MKADNQKWIDATANLNARRSNHTTQKRAYSPASDYTSHLNKCGFGKSVLDVGCGSQYLKSCLPEDVTYVGVDAFPIVSNTIECAIEDLVGLKVDTVCAYAVLDNCREFYKACDSMKRIAQKNISILTGIGIEPDQFHTFKIEFSNLDEAFKGWTLTHKEEIVPKVWLINYQK